MRVALGILGAILGFAVGIVFTEVIFPNNQDWPTVVPFALAVLGWLVGSTAAQRRRRIT
jgi:hypothetical protein